MRENPLFLTLLLYRGILPTVPLEVIGLDKSLRKYILPVFCVGVLFIYFHGIFKINFSFEPSYYSTDMYTDMRYAVEAWSKKSIFPDG